MEAQPVWTTLTNGADEPTWKKVVKVVAPALATATLGPLAGLATTAISEAVLGRSGGTEAELAEALASPTPGMLLSLREAEYSFKTRLEEIHAADRANAREREIRTRDKTPRNLAWGLMLLFGMLLAGLMFYEPPAGSQAVLFTAVGTAFIAMITYFFGSSVGSNEKTGLMAGMADKIQALMGGK